MLGKDTSTHCGPFAALRYRDFRLYFGIRFFFTFAYQMQATIIGFYIYQLTHSKVAIAMIGLSEVIPAIGIALYGGYIADKYEKRKMLRLVCTGFLLTSVVMFCVTLQNIRAYIAVEWIPCIIYALLFCNGIARAFYEPAAFSVYAGSVPGDIYPLAGTWNNLSWQAATIAGPVTGGLIYAFTGAIIPGVAGISATFAVIIVLLLVTLFLIGRLRKYPTLVVKGEKFGKSFFAGLHFVFHNKVMLYAMSLDLFSVFFGGVSALLPVYATDIFKTGANGLGWMRVSMSLGATLTMVLMTRFPLMGKPWRNLLIAVTGFGCAIIGFGLSGSLGMALVFLFAQGAFDSVSVMIRGVIMQLLTPENMRGRVSAVNSLFISSSSEIGDFESGMAASLLGTIPAVLFGGGMTLFIVLLTWFKTPRLLNVSLDELQASK